MLHPESAPSPEGRKHRHCLQMLPLGDKIGCGRGLVCRISDSPFGRYLEQHT